MRAWVLNFDSDEEFARGEGYTPAKALVERFEGLITRVGALLGPGDILVSDASVDASGLVGRAWCPTPRAVRTLAKAGAASPLAPPFEVIRRVNHRRFCAELGQTLPGARFVTTWGDLEATLASASPTGQWLLKRAFGFAGRGRRKVRGSAIEEAAHGWIEASLGEGLQVEPWVERDGDMGLHGFIGRSGRMTLGEPTTQTIDGTGAWLRSERAAPDALMAAERNTLFASAEATSAALFTAGYFGPFGIDAFRYRDADGTLCWNPRCEINARYSMGWAAGMGDRRPDLDAFP